MKRILIFCAVVGMLTISSTQLANAGIITYYGVDNSPVGTVPPGGNALAARLNFLSGLSGGVGTENFQSLAPPASTGPFSLTFTGSTGNITATLSGSNLDLRNTPISGTYATSATQFLRAITSTSTAGSEFVIDFSKPIAAFGFYGTDLGDAGGGNLVMTLANGTNQQLTVPVSGLPSGNLIFYGFISDTDQFSKITFANTAGSGDFWGFDDMTIGDIGQIRSAPEPASLAVFGVFGLSSVLIARRRHRKIE